LLWQTFQEVGYTGSELNQYIGWTGFPIGLNPQFFRIVIVFLVGESHLGVEVVPEALATHSKSLGPGCLYTTVLDRSLVRVQGGTGSILVVHGEYKGYDRHGCWGKKRGRTSTGSLTE
jgi:hypothetical protein